MSCAASRCCGGVAKPRSGSSPQPKYRNISPFRSWSRRRPLKGHTAAILAGGSGHNAEHLHADPDQPLQHGIHDTFRAILRPYVAQRPGCDEPHGESRQNVLTPESPRHRHRYHRAEMLTQSRAGNAQAPRGLNQETMTRPHRASASVQRGLILTLHKQSPRP
jgi:ferric-dicitrate binding protein FerR (iron transport regulator)